MNSATMTRQVHELGRKRGGAIARIVSLNPINPRNSADLWEREIFGKIEAGEEEGLSFELVDGEDHVRLMRPLITEKACLSCHEQHGHREGDIRGGISISVSTGPFKAAENKNLFVLIRGHFLLWLPGLPGVFHARYVIRRKNARNVRSEAALLASEKRFREMTETVPLAVVMLDRAGRVTFCNDHLLESTGFKREEVPGQGWFARFVSEESRGAAELAYYQRSLAGKLFEDYSYEIVTKSGEKRLISWKRALIRDETSSVVGLTCVGEDITEREQARLDLKASEERFRSLMEKMLDGFALHEIICDDPGKPVNYRFLDVNASFERLTGLSRERIVGATVLDVLPDTELLSEGELPNAASNLARNAAGEPSGPDEFNLIRQDGTTACLELRTYPTKIKGQPLVLGIARDVTERKKAERERESLEAQLRQAQKMEAIGTLAGGIAHDFNNILAAILGYSELALLQLMPQDEVAQFLEEIKSAGCRARDVVGQILTFSRQTEQKKKPVQMGLLVKEIAKLVRASIPSSIESRSRPPSG